MPLSTFLNGRPPERLRGVRMLAFSELGNVLTLTYVDDQGGGATQTWGTATAVQCRIDSIGGNGRGMTGGRIDERSTHVVTVPAGTSVNAQDRFLIAARGTFEVTATRERTAEWSTTFEVVEV